MKLRRTRYFLITKLCSRNLIKGINTSLLPLFKILRSILIMNKCRCQKNGAKDKKIDENAQKTLHSTDNIVKLHVLRKKLEELPSIENRKYIRKS